MKKTFKMLLIVTLVTIMILSFASSVIAVTGTPTTPKEVQDNADYSMSDNTLLTTAGRVIGVIRNISVIAAVIIIMVLGVKYMMGSVEEKAEYKKSFLPLIIGVLCVVAASSIAGFIFNLAGSN